MRFSLALTLAAISAVVSASTIQPLLRRQGFPDCAGPCIANADTTGCDPTDNKCLCSKSSFVNTVTYCIEDSCKDSPKDIESAEAAARALCAAVGVTITSVPPRPTSTAESASSTSVDSTASSTTSVASSTSSNASSAASSVSKTASSATGSSTSSSAPGNGAFTNGAPLLTVLGAVGVVFAAL